MENQDSKAVVVTPETTLLEIVEAYPEATKIFDRYNDRAGECIVCHSLFEPLKVVIEKYDLDEKELLTELRSLRKTS